MNALPECTMLVNASHERNWVLEEWHEAHQGA